MKKSQVIKKIFIVLIMMFTTVFITSVEASEDEYYIVSQPTGDNPTIEVNGDAEYQWYELVQNRLEITNENATCVSSASYDNQTGWVGAETENGLGYFTKEFNEGDFLIITPNEITLTQDNFILVGPSRCDATTLDGEIIFEIASAGNYTVYTAFDSGITFKASLLLSVSEEAIDGETSNTLNNYEISKYYFVNVTFADGTTLNSNIFKVNYAITNQPTSESFVVDTNKDSAVKKYQWYKRDTSDYYDVTNLYTLVNGKVNAYLYSGNYSNGIWSSYSGYINLCFEGALNDQVKVTLNEEFNGVIKLYYSDTYFEEQADGSFIYTLTDESYIDFVIRDEYENPIEATIELIRDSKSYPVVFENTYFDDEKGMYYTPDVDDGYYKDGKWYSEEYEIDIDFILEEGCIIEVLVGKDFNGTFYIADYENDSELVDGKFTYTTDGEITDFELIIINDDEEEFEATINVLKDNKKYVVSEYTYFDDKNMVYNDAYSYLGYCKDRVWYANSDNVLSMELMANEGDILTITPSEGFEGKIVIYSYYAGDELTLKPIEGVYRYVSNYNSYIYIYMEASKEFSTTIQIQKSSKVLLEDQTTKTLTPNASGYYFVEVEFIDGELEVSDTFMIESMVIYEEFGGSEVLDFTGLVLEEAPVSTRVGYILDGWYSDSEYNNKVTYPYNVVGNNTLYAKWIKCDHSDSSNKPTCTDSAVCSVCGGNISLTGHSYSVEYTQNNDTHWFDCINCDEHLSEEAHKFTDWVITKSATRKEEGLEQRACTVCGHLESKTIEKTKMPVGAIVGIVSGSVVSVLGALAAAYWFVFKKKAL